MSYVSLNDSSNTPDKTVEETPGNESNQPNLPVNKISSESQTTDLKFLAEQIKKLIIEAEQQKSRIAALESAHITLLLENVFLHQKLTQTSIIMPIIQQKPFSSNQPNNFFVILINETLTIQRKPSSDTQSDYLPPALSV